MKYRLILVLCFLNTLTLHATEGLDLKNGLEIFQAANPTISFTDQSGANSVKTDGDLPMFSQYHLSGVKLSKEEKEQIFGNLFAYFGKSIAGKGVLENGMITDDWNSPQFHFMFTKDDITTHYAVNIVQDSIIINLVYTSSEKDD